MVNLPSKVLLAQIFFNFYFFFFTNHSSGSQIRSTPGTDPANSKAQRPNGGQPPKRNAPGRGCTQGRDLANSKIQRRNGGRPPKRRAPDLSKEEVVAKLQGDPLQSGPRIQRKRKRDKGDPDNGARVSSRGGKKVCISIWKKMHYIGIFRKFQDDPSVRYPYAAFFKESRPGCYYGCFTKNDGTGWIDRAQADSWELFVKHCENMSKRYSEVPNWARQLLNLETFKGTSPWRTIPVIVEAAVEELAMVSIKDLQEVRGLAIVVIKV